MTGPRAKTEFALQKMVAEYLRLALPPFVCWSAIGHGGGGKVRGAMLKASGTIAGVPDVMLVHNGRALFIELKGVGGALSPAQVGFHNWLRVAGAKIAVCRSIDDVQAALREWQVPMCVNEVGKFGESA